MKEKENLLLLKNVQELLTEACFDGRQAKIHITRCNPNTVRITLYYGDKPITRKLNFNKKVNIKFFAKLICKEYNYVFKHIKKRDKNSLSIY